MIMQTVFAYFSIWFVMRILLKILFYAAAIFFDLFCKYITSRSLMSWYERKTIVVKSNWSNNKIIVVLFDDKLIRSQFEITFVTY